MQEKTKRSLIILHGTNGWFETVTGCTSCTGIYFDDAVIFCDLGTGFSKVRSEVTRHKNVYILLTHLHLDHIYGLHLLAAHAPRSLTICVPSALKDALIRIAAPPFIATIPTLEQPMSVVGLTEGIHQYDNFSLTALNGFHNTAVMLYRIRLGKNIISYCIDTGPCANAVAIAKDANVLICDAALRPEDHKEHRYHMTPYDAAAIAAEANVRQLVLTHFGPNHYRTLADRAKIAGQIKGIFSKNTIGMDGIEIVL